MEPSNQGTHNRIEKTPSLPIEYTTIDTNFAHDSQASYEHSLEQHREQLYSARVEAAKTASNTNNITIPQIPVDRASDNNTALNSSGVPIIASDDDLIEKEWVDQAKKIIASTKDNPYMREKEISKLQIEYIRRRYGREIGESNN